MAENEKKEAVLSLRAAVSLTPEALFKVALDAWADQGTLMKAIDAANKAGGSPPCASMLFILLNRVTVDADYAGRLLKQLQDQEGMQCVREQS